MQEPIPALQAQNAGSVELMWHSLGGANSTRKPQLMGWPPSFALASKGEPRCTYCSHICKNTRRRSWACTAVAACLPAVAQAIAAVASTSLLAPLAIPFARTIHAFTCSGAVESQRNKKSVGSTDSAQRSVSGKELGTAMCRRYRLVAAVRRQCRLKAAVSEVQNRKGVVP